MIDSKQLRMCIIKPALLDLQMFSEAAEELMVFTCAAESMGGTYLRQINGPALGIYQMEPATYNDIWQNRIKNKVNIYVMLIHNFGINSMPPEDKLIYDLRYATAMSRIFYERIPSRLPEAHDIDGIWNYYKTYYNTAKGSATKERCIAAYNRYIKA